MRRLMMATAKKEITMQTKSNKTIRIDLDTLNDGANVEALEDAIIAEFPEADVVIRNTGRGTEVEGFEDDDAARAALRAVVECADF